MDGIVNYLKPSGLSSSQAVGRVKRIFQRRDVGHLGTLDPFAAGVLPIAVGKATRLFDYYLSKTKSYRAVVKFGLSSDTLDTAGKVERNGELPIRQEVTAAVKEFVGTYAQIPPAYSAKSINGVRAYELARQGRAVELHAKEVSIFRCEVIGQTDEATYTIDIDCAAGTYIRSLARDIAARLGTSAVLAALIRTKCGEWTLENALTDSEILPSFVIPTETLLKSLPRVDLPECAYKQISNGVEVEWSDHCVTPFTVYCRGELFGLGKQEQGRVKIATYLHE